MDFYLFQLIHQWVGNSKLLDGIMVLLAHWLTPVLIIVLLVMGIEQLWRTRSVPYPFLLLMSGTLAWCIQFFITLVIFFPRPFDLLSFTPLIGYEHLGSSFPSGHASFLFGMAFFLLLYGITTATPPLMIRGGWGALRSSIFFLLAFLVSFARVYVGVHWPLDIVGGFFTGLLAACLMRKVLHYMQEAGRHRAYKIFRD